MPIVPQALRPISHPLLRRLIVLAVVAAVVLIVGLAYIVAIYLPTQNVVTTGGGSWIVNGASASLGISVGCSTCGQKIAPGNEFTVDVNVGVASTACGYFGCPGYSIQSFSVDAPYTLVTIAPHNLPHSQASGEFNTWALTIKAPTTQGHYPLSGIVAVAYY